MKENTIYHSECVLGMKEQIEDNSIDLVVTSPPYDDLRNYQGYTFDFEAVAKELWRVIKPGGVVVWIVGDATINGSETGTSFRQALFFKEIGFNLHDTMIYEKDSISFPDTNRYYQTFEYMFVFSKGKPKVVHLLDDRANKWGNGKKRILGRERQEDGTLSSKRKGNLLKPFGVRFNIWRYAIGKNKSTKDNMAFEHPAIFPEELARDHILSWSDPGDLILDPFMGSGTTAKMAIVSDRRYVGFEISEEYCTIAKRRLENLQMNLMT
ncbi:DNA-methyltransferase [Exiguobacterium indicum]|uniref:DNA-methyltransferase n=1 Tax=Exiguobacterium indicum TaxID=296995 RepID=UPI000B33A3F4|nr:site-specific DNA-methyltransferase [Exiguobacterium indicum]